MVPAWPSQSWYIRIVQMLISQPVVMVWTKETRLLIHPSGPRAHNMQGRLKLMACQVSGDTTKCRAFLNTLPTHGDLPLRNIIQFILRNGLYSVVQGKLLHFSPDLNDVLEFLYNLLNLSYSSLNTSRSALSCIMIDKIPVGQHPVVCRFLKGAFEQNPPAHKYYGIWDVKQVLQFC